MCDKTHYNDYEFEIVLYETIGGTIPFYEFISSLDKTSQAKVLKCVDKLSKLGNKAKQPLSKSINSGIFELRINQNKNTYRVLYFFYIRKKIVLMNGFMKKTNKTPNREIEKAIMYKKDWLRRNNDEI